MENACETKKKALQSNDDSNISKNSRQITIVVSFSDLITTEVLRSLDLTDVPKILRFHIYDRLSCFKGLKSLVLGSGTGGWSNMYIEKFANGVKNMKHLVKFSLCYDCTDLILKLLSRNCYKTLKIIDVEMSKQVTDASVEALVKCKDIHTLHVFHTGISVEGYAAIIMKLCHLKLLVRGGFLCEALEHVASENSKLPILPLEEFWSSEEYFFHDDGQMALVQKMCPNIRKMMFQFSTEVMTDLLFLTRFSKLAELHLWGGEFYLDKINLVLMQMGSQLTTLYLIHTEEMDERAIITISKHCPFLNTLGFYNCEFKERTNTMNEEAQNIFPQREKEEDMEPLLDLKTLAIVSECKPKIAARLLSSALNLEHFKSGIHCHLTDNDLEKILQINKMQHLKAWNMPQTKYLTIYSVNLLMDHCSKLESITDLNYWEGISKEELKNLRKTVIDANYDLDVGNEPVEMTPLEQMNNLNDDIVNYLMGNIE